MAAPDENDFVKGALVDLGLTVSRTPVTTIQDNVTGEKIQTDGTPADITAVFLKRSQFYKLGKEGLVEEGDAIMLCDKDQTLSKNDKITYGGETYRVDTIITRHFGSNDMFKKAILYLIS